MRFLATISRAHIHAALPFVCALFAAISIGGIAIPLALATPYAEVGSSSSHTMRATIEHLQVTARYRLDYPSIPETVVVAKVEKDQSRFIQEDPWVVNVIPTITFRRDEYERATVIPRPRPKKKSEADPSALLSYAKAFVGKSGPQLGLPRRLWCADFINYIARKAGLSGSGSRLARSFLSSRNFVRVKAPRKGDIVVLRRGKNPTYGHVGVYGGKCSRGILLVGGNQRGGRVSSDCVPTSKVVGYAAHRATVPNVQVAKAS